MKFSHEKLETLRQRWWKFKFCDPSLHRFDTAHECDRQSDRRPGHG